MLCYMVVGRVNPRDVAESDWPLLVEQAERHKLGPMLWRALHQVDLQIERDLQERVEFALQHTSMMNMLLEDELQAVETTLVAAQIPTIWFKGLALAHTVYPNAMLRPMGDLDVLVPYDQREAALRLVEMQGYYFSGDDRLLFGHGEDLFLETAHHYHLQRNGIVTTVLELHFRLLGRNADLLPLSRLAWFHDQTLDIDIRDVSCKTLAPHAHLLYLCAHAIIQHGEGAIDFLHYLDIHLLLSQSEIDWDAVVNQARVLRWTYALERALEWSVTLFGTSVPDEILSELKAHRGEDDHRQWAQILSQDQDATEWDRIQIMLRRMSLRQRIRMMWRMAFPPASYMKLHYEIPTGRWVGPYYLYRWWGQAGKIAQSIKRKFRS